MDYRDLSPIVWKLRALELPIPITDERKGRLTETQRSRTSLEVRSTLAQYRTPLFRIRKGLYIETGEYCVLLMYDSAEAAKRRQRQRASIPSPFAEAETFVSKLRYDNDVFKNDYYFKATCVPVLRVGNCITESYFESWSISFDIPKDRLCRWREELGRVQDFLARHVTERTVPQQKAR